MEVNGIVEELDRQIARLKEARALLAGGATSGKKRGRPPGKSAAKQVSRKRRLTPEGRKRISEALKKRWAQRRKATGAKSAKAA